MKPTSFAPQEIISYTEMCSAEAMSLQHGMNFREKDSVFLMSLRKGAPYNDSFDRETNTLIYEGHDVPRRVGYPDPKLVDQPLDRTSRNTKFFEAARDYQEGRRTNPLRIRVYEKLLRGIWVFNGTFSLQRAWQEPFGSRLVVKFRLHLVDDMADLFSDEPAALSQTRLIPSSVKQEVFKRDGGKCVLCSSKENLHFDHDLAYSLGGTSLLAQNIRLLCAKHNLAKGARLE